MNLDNGSVIPPILTPGKFVHSTADNVNINDTTLDGKNTFHASQMAAWQRGPTPHLMLNDMKRSKKQVLNVPAPMEKLSTLNLPEDKVQPSFAKPVEMIWFDNPATDSVQTRHAKAVDIAFVLKRQSGENKIGWTEFNQSWTRTNPVKSAVGYMPIIQAPAHEIDTLNTVFRRCMYVATQLGQVYVVLTVDQALYYKLMQVKWMVPEYKDRLIPRLGGFHILLNFLKVIGQHMKGCGIHDAWVESGIFGPTHVSKGCLTSITKKCPNP